MAKTGVWADVQRDPQDGLWRFKIFSNGVKIVRSVKGYDHETVCRGAIKRIQEEASNAAVLPLGGN